MNEWNKAQAGYLYDANYDRKLWKTERNALICAMNLISANHRIQKTGGNYKENNWMY